MSQQRANALGDYANFFTHFGMVAAVSAGAFVTLGFPPVLGAAAIGLTAAIRFGLVPVIGKGFQDAIRDEKLFLERLSPLDGLRNPGKDRETSLRKRVDGWVEEYSAKLGLRQKPELLVMSENGARLFPGEATSLSSKLRLTLLREFNKHMNAFAFSHDKKHVVLTSPIVKELDERELKGIVAHEVGHLAANHRGFRDIMGMISTPAKFLTGLNLLVTAFSSIKNAGLYIAAGSLASIAADKYAEFRDLDKENPRHKASIKQFERYTGQALLAGGAIALGAPEVLAAQALNLATKEAFDLIEKHYSRCNEFQADRLSAEVTHDPESLCSGLKKIQRAALKAEPGFNYEQKPANENKGFLSRLFDGVRDLKKTHPSIERRCEALRKPPGPAFTSGGLPGAMQLVA